MQNNHDNKRFQQPVTNYKFQNATCMDAALKALTQTQQNKALERNRRTSVRCLYTVCSVTWTLVMIQLNSM